MSNKIFFKKILYVPVNYAPRHSDNLLTSTISYKLFTSNHQVGEFMKTTKVMIIISLWW